MKFYIIRASGEVTNRACKGVCVSPIKLTLMVRLLEETPFLLGCFPQETEPTGPGTKTVGPGTVNANYLTQYQNVLNLT